MKRILFFVSSMEGGGAERVAALLCNHWVTQGHDVMLVPTFSGRGECLYPLDERVRLEYLADRVGTLRRTPWSMGRRLLAMRAMVREFKTDVVVSFLPNVNVATILATRGMGGQVVVSERTYPPAMNIGPFWSLLRRLVYPWASAVVMQTAQGLEWLSREIPRSFGEVVPNPCVYPLPDSVPELSPGAVIPYGRRVILGVGRLSEEKGFSQLISAFDQLAHRYLDWDLIILGEGRERGALEAQVASLGLENRVYLPGRVGNLSVWYQRAGLYVMSSQFEGFPNTLMEAMAHGVAVVSFDFATGPADLIEEGKNGYLVLPSYGSEGLAARMDALLANDHVRKRMAEEAKHVRGLYSLNQVAKQWDRVMELGHNV